MEWCGREVSKTRWKDTTRSQCIAMPGHNSCDPDCSNEKGVRHRYSVEIQFQLNLSSFH